MPIDEEQEEDGEERPKKPGGDLDISPEKLAELERHANTDEDEREMTLTQEERENIPRPPLHL